MSVNYISKPSSPISNKKHEQISETFQIGDERNSAKYIGQLNKGTPNGYGTMIWKDGKMYTGTIKQTKTTLQ
jgi:hypothetical protein